MKPTLVSPSKGEENIASGNGIKNGINQFNRLRFVDLSIRCNSHFLSIVPPCTMHVVRQDFQFGNRDVVLLVFGLFVSLLGTEDESMFQLPE